MARYCGPELYYEPDPGTDGQFGARFPPWVTQMKTCSIQCTYENKKCVRLDEQFESHKLAYVFTITKDDISDYLHTHAITCQVQITDEEYNIDLFCNKSQTPDRIITLLRDKLKDIEYFCINLNAQEGQNVKRMLHNRPTAPTQICNKKAIVLGHGMMLHCVAGNVDHLDNLLNEMNYNETEDAELADFPINLSALGIQKSKLHEDIEQISIHESEQKCVITWKGRIKKRSKDLFHEFLNSCDKYELNFIDDATKKPFNKEAIKVIFDSDGTMNETYLGYLMKRKRKEKKCNYFALIHHNNSIVLYGRGENVSFLKTDIENSMSRLKLPYTFFRSKEGREYLGKYTQKLTYNLMTCVLVCTHDLRDQLLLISVGNHGKMPCISFGFLSEFLVDFLQKSGGRELSRLKKNFDIDFQINYRSITLYLEEGQSNLTKDIKKYFGKLTSCKKMDTSSTGLDFAEVGRVMDENQCSWKLYSEGEVKCIGSDECRLVWLDPYRATKLSLLQADKCSPYVDIWIELTTDELQSLGLNPISQDHRLLLDHNRKTQDKRVGYMEVVNGPFPTSGVLAGCSMVLAIVVRAGIDGTSSDVIENTTLRGMFVKALETSRQVHKNICLNAVFAQKDPELALADVIAQFVLAIKAVSKQARPEFTQKVSIIVDEKELEVAKRLIESRMSKNVMVCDKPHVSEKKTRSESHLKLKVIVGTITESKCDVIVNTTNKRLDFSQGTVSMKISKLAGNGLKEECEQFYPNGIEEGIVAYTKSHDLKNRSNIKYVFHCALPDYKSATFETNVKDTVKSCLYLAEELGCKKISFPALGVGNKKYPRRETASTIMRVVENFSKAVDLSNLKKVHLVCFGEDTLTRKAFQTESWRRSKECKAPEKNAFHKLSDKIVGTKTIVPTTLVIAVQDISIKLPSFAVQVKFDKEKGCLVWKSAKELPMTWNDELYFDAIESLQNGRCLSGLLDYIDIERITFLVWNLDRDSKHSYGDQIEWIANAHERMLEQGTVYLQKAVILVPDNAAVTSFREKEKAKEESLWSWDECLDAVMVVVGPSEAHTLKANEQVAKMIEEKKKSIMKQQGPKADEEDRQVGTYSTLHGNGKKTNTSQEYPKIIPAVSATINPGIMRFIGNGFNRWKDMFEQTFNVEITKTHDGITGVRGNYKDVEHFEEYLSKDFPSEINLNKQFFV